MPLPPPTPPCPHCGTNKHVNLDGMESNDTAHILYQLCCSLCSSRGIKTSDYLAAHEAWPLKDPPPPSTDLPEFDPAFFPTRTRLAVRLLGFTLASVDLDTCHDFSGPTRPGK